MCRAINFHVSLIYREGNKCDDRLANLGLDSRVEFAWYDRLPICTQDLFRTGMVYRVFVIATWIWCCPSWLVV